MRADAMNPLTALVLSSMQELYTSLNAAVPGKAGLLEGAKSKRISYRVQDGLHIVVHDDIARSSASIPIETAVFHKRGRRCSSDTHTSRISFEFWAKEYLIVHSECLNFF